MGALTFRIAAHDCVVAIPYLLDGAYPSTALCSTLLRMSRLQAGAGIFCATEGWTYGIGIYFCKTRLFAPLIVWSSFVLVGFIAFTTTGYGDYSPETPAGRSIFVFWALFGVGTLTILVSGRHS